MPLNVLHEEEKMASSEKMNPDSDDEVDLEALRLAALQTLHAKPKFTPHINHNNLIPIVPINVVTPIMVHPSIKLEPISPTLEENIQVNSRLSSPNKDEEDKDSVGSESGQDGYEDILSMDDKEEEDSLERLMDQLEAEISGKAPILSNRTVIAPKKQLNESKGGHRREKKSKKRDIEVELVGVKIGKQQGPVINIRESPSPQPTGMTSFVRNSGTPARSKSPKRNSRSPKKSKSRSPKFRRSRSFKRSPSPYWSKSPRRSRSVRRSRSPYWVARRSKSLLRKSRSPYRRSKSPFSRRRSPFRYSSRTRSRSFDRRSRSPWSYSPKKRSKSPHFRDSFSPFNRRRNLLSPDKSRKRSSISPRGKSRSPRHKSRSPRRFLPRRNSPFQRSKTPIRRSRSPVRNKSPLRRVKSPYRSSISPFTRRSKSPLILTDLQRRKSPLPSVKNSLRRSKSANKRSLSPTRRQKSPNHHSKSPDRSARDSSNSPSKKNEVTKSIKRSPLSKSKRSRTCSISPRRRNRSPLRGIEKNKIDEIEKPENTVNRNRQEKRPRTVSKDRRNENYKKHDRRLYRSRGFRRYSPSRGGRSLDRQRRRSRSPKKKPDEEKPKDSDMLKNQLEGKGSSPVSMIPIDPVLEARKKKFENLNEVDPTIDKKISLKSIKEPSENPTLEDDDDALNINLESDLWEESEESENEHESRFKTGEPKFKTNRTVLSFRSLRDDDSKKINLNKPLAGDRRDRYNHNRFDRWHRGRRNERNDKNHKKRYREDETIKNKNENELNREKKFEPCKNKSVDKDLHINKKNSRKVIIFSTSKDNVESKDSEVSTTCGVNSSESQSVKEVSDNNERINGTKIDKIKSDNRETDDFDKLISDFEKELESDICLPPKDLVQTVSVEQSEVKRLRISVKKDLFEPCRDTIVRKTLPSVSRINEISSNKEKGKRTDDVRRLINEREEAKESGIKLNQIEDYVENDDFVLDDTCPNKRGRARTEEDDNQNDLRDILSRRRNERLTKAGSLHENMPARLLQSAFQGLGNKKSKRLIRESQSAKESPTIDRSIKTSGPEKRRVLLLQRKKPDVPSFKVTVPEAKPDTTIQQRLTRIDERSRSRKLQKHLESLDETDQEEQECFEAEGKQPRRIRLKRNVTVSSQSVLLNREIGSIAGINAQIDFGK